MKKLFSAIIFSVISATAANSLAFSFTSTPAPGPAPSGFAVLANEIQALATAAAQEFNDFMFQTDVFFPTGSNNANSSARANVDKYAAQLTESQISSQLSTIPEQGVPASQLGDQDLINKLNAQKNLVQQLTAGTPASDTLYSSGVDGLLAGIFGAAKPTTTYDNYFNFDTLIGPSAYNQNQLTAAQMYLNYLTQSYKSITPGVDYQGLKNKLLSISSPIDRAKWLNAQVINNPIYQNYQLNVRSNMAARSLAISNFNQLLGQRVPIKGLGTAAGLPQDPNLPNGYASLLQSEDYAALSLVNNPAWYKSMQTASPATVDREQLLLLATLVKQNQQAEETNQRLLATMSLMTLEMNSTQALLMQAQAQQVNSIWNGQTAATSTASATSNPLAGAAQAIAGGGS